MSILSTKELKNRIFDLTEEDISKKLIVTPLLNLKQLKDASLDVRFGSEFIVIKHTNLASIDPAAYKDIKQNLGTYQKRVKIGFGEKFILHPYQFVLGSKLEFFSFPDDLSAQVEVDNLG